MWVRKPLLIPIHTTFLDHPEAAENKSVLSQFCLLFAPIFATLTLHRSLMTLKLSGKPFRRLKIRE
jgi:hypothetical protein